MKKINCILLVDDNPADNEFHEIIIQQAGVCEQIKVAYDGVEALDYLRKAGAQVEGYPLPDVIFLDINMPKMNGFEFLEQYMKLDEGLRSKVIIMMLTTSLNPDDEKRAKQFGFLNGFSHKPLTPAVLKKLVETHFPY